MKQDTYRIMCQVSVTVVTIIPVEKGRRQISVKFQNRGCPHQQTTITIQQNPERNIPWHRVN